MTYNIKVFVMSFMNDPLLDNISVTEDDCFVQKTRTGRSIFAQNIFLPVEMALKVGQRAVLDGLVKLPDLVLEIHSLKQEDLKSGFMKPLYCISWWPAFFSRGPNFKLRRYGFLASRFYNGTGFFTNIILVSKNDMEYSSISFRIVQHNTERKKYRSSEINLGSI